MACVDIMLSKELSEICSVVNNIYPLFYYDLCVTALKLQ